MFSGRPALNGVGFFCAWVFCSMRMVCALLCGWAGFVDLKDRVMISFAGGLLGVYEARCGWGVAGLTWCEVVGVWQGDCCWLCDTAGQKAIHR